MSQKVILEDDVIKALKDKAIELDMVFNTINDVLRKVLSIEDRKEVDTYPNYPSSNDIDVQLLLDGLKNTVYSISPDGMNYYENRRRWVANPNTVTITVQDRRSKNLRITVYGAPNDFTGMHPHIDLRPDMNGYSRFVISEKKQLPSAIKIIEQSYKIKRERGRF